MNSIIRASFALFALLAIAGANQAEACGGNQCAPTPGVTSDAIYGATTRFTTDIVGAARGGWTASGAPAQGNIEAFTRGLGVATTTGTGTYNGSACSTCADAQFHLQGTFNALQEAGVRSHVVQQGNQPGSIEVGTRAMTDVIGTGAFRATVSR